MMQIFGKIFSGPFHVPASNDKKIPRACTNTPQYFHLNTLPWRRYFSMFSTAIQYAIIGYFTVSD